jgi:hypothetical protein
VVRIERLKDKTKIEALLRKNAELHVYSLGDLDDFFWPCTTWYGWASNGDLQDVVLVYAGTGLPTVVGIGEQPGTLAARMCEAVPLLPQRFYAHLSPGVEEVFRGTHQIDPPRPPSQDGPAGHLVSCRRRLLTSVSLDECGLG